MKIFLTICAKQAVGAIVGNAALWALLPSTFNPHDLSGWINFGKATIGFVAAAEGKVWIPKLLAWVNSPTPGE
jgi:hypothetical protein